MATTWPFQWGGVGKELCPSCGGNWPQYTVKASYGPLRVSSVARYGAGFTPTWGWKADAQTIGVWNLEEGAGTTTADGSGNGLTAKLVATGWAKTPRPAPAP